MRTPRTACAVILAIEALACSSSTDPTDRNIGASDGEDVPACGTDPARQPARCVDGAGALRCKVDTGYPGDELALCDLDPEEGMVLHFGPTDYADPDDVARFILPPGGEDEFCLRVNTPNTTEKFFDSYHGRMRPNSHHLIVTMPPGHAEAETMPWHCGPQVLDRWLIGSQDPELDGGGNADGVPAQPGAPDFGLAHDVPANQTLLLDFHNLNATEGVELREAWTSFDYVDAEDVLVRSDLIGFYNMGIDIPPLARATTSRMRCEPPTDASGEQQPVYVNLMTGHAHQRMTRFSVWHDKRDGSQDLVYETFDWLEPGNATYRDRLQNPVLPVPEGQRWGAASGYLNVLPGEALSFECEFENDLDATVRVGETSKDEMCNVFGTYFPTVGGMWNCFGG